MDKYCYIKERVYYKDGMIFWKPKNDGSKRSESWNKKYSGKRAGYDGIDGYRFVSVWINKVENVVFEHRLIWYINKGSVPNQIDHIDGDRQNNKIENLRDVPQNINAKNQKIRKTNKTGIMGVWWNKYASKWYAHISNEGKKTSLGYYDDFFEACCARKSAESRLGYSKTHGRKV